MTAGQNQTAMMRIAVMRQGLDSALDQIAGRVEALATGRAPTPFAVPEESGLAGLGRIFGLGGPELELIALAAGQELSPRIAEALAGVTATGAIDPEFCARLLGPPAWDMLCPDAALRHWRLIEQSATGPLRRRVIRIDERIMHYLLGAAYVDPRLAGLLRPVQRADMPCAGSEQPAMAQGAITPLAETIIAAWAGAAQPAVILVGGTNQDGKRAAAAEAARHLGMLALRIDAAELPGDGAQRQQLAVLLDRELALSGGLLLIEAAAAHATAAARLAEIIGGPVILSAEDPEIPDRMPRLRRDLDLPDSAERAAIWRRALGQAADGLGRDLDRIAAQFALDPCGIATAISEADRPGAEAADLPQRLWQAARHQGRRALDGLAQRIDSRAVWQDLVLPPDQTDILHELAGHLREQWTVNRLWGWEARGSRGLGAAALFSGPPGTGKTLAAEVLAGELALDLYRIDLSQVVSKYIGETEKNLSRIFATAEQGGAILLFDEADALFGKRSEVRDSHDRYANVEVSYLLQQMEAYRGLAVLTTNQRSALDPAFMRRLRHVINFPFPDAEARAEIWRRIFPDATPQQGVDPVALSRLSVSGGSIRSIALNAAYLAAADGGAVTMRHLLRAARREYAKLEKPFTAAEQGAFR